MPSRGLQRQGAVDGLKRGAPGTGLRARRETDIPDDVYFRAMEAIG